MCKRKRVRKAKEHRKVDIPIDWRYEVTKSEINDSNRSVKTK